MIFERAERELVEAGLGHLADIILDSSLATIAGDSDLIADDAAVGTSRIGGEPDLPCVFSWPLRDGRPLSFVAQINLSDVCGLGGADALPGAGWLWFFYDFEGEPWGFAPEDRGGWRVHFEGDPAVKLVRSSGRAESKVSGTISFRSLLTFPWVWGGRDLSASMDDDEKVAIEDFLDRSSPSSIFGRHGIQLLGFPSPKQSDDMEAECAGASNGIEMGDAQGFELLASSVHASTVDRWRLLFQIDSHDAGPGWGWGGRGRLFFWIEEDALRDREFDNVWLILQCS